MANFQKLEVYIKAQEIINDIYIITKKYPRDEKFGMIDQIRRAAVSIAANIAEGSGRYHIKDHTQFLRIARGSSYETIALLDISAKQNYITKEEYENIFDKTEQLNRMLNAFITAISKRG